MWADLVLEVFLRQYPIRMLRAGGMGWVVMTESIGSALNLPVKGVFASAVEIDPSRLAGVGAATVPVAAAVPVVCSAPVLQEAGRQTVHIVKVVGVRESLVEDRLIRWVVIAGRVVSERVGKKGICFFVVAP